eukprot:2281899-Amphidinium_carterae.1
MCQAAWRSTSQGSCGESGPGKESHSKFGDARSTGDPNERQQRRAYPCPGYRAEGTAKNAKPRARQPTSAGTGPGCRTPCTGARVTGCSGEAGRGDGRRQWRASKPRGDSWRGARRRCFGGGRSAQAHPRYSGRGRRPAAKSAAGCRGSPDHRAPTLTTSGKASKGQVHRSKLVLCLVSSLAWLETFCKHLSREHPEVTGTPQGAHFPQSVVPGRTGKCLLCLPWSTGKETPARPGYRPGKKFGNFFFSPFALCFGAQVSCRVQEHDHPCQDTGVCPAAGRALCYRSQPPAWKSCLPLSDTHPHPLAQPSSAT